MSLKYRIALVIFALEAVLMGAVLTQTISQFDDSTRHHLAEAEQVVLSLLSPVARKSLLTHEFAEMQPYLEQVGGDPRVLRAMLLDHRGIVVASLEASDIGSPLPKPSGDSNRFWRQMPISDATGVAGMVAVEFSNVSLVQASASIRRKAVAIAGAGMLFIALVGVATGVLLTRKLDRVAEAARLLAGGDLAARSEVVGNDEIGQLGRTFDDMARALTIERGEMEKTQEALRQKEEHYRFLVDNAPISIHEIDLDGRLRSMSQCGLDMMGITDEHAVAGLPFPQLAENTDRNELHVSLRRALNGEPRELEFVRTISGEKRTFRTGFYPVADAQGRITSLLGLTEDVSERKRAEEALAMSQSRLRQAQKMEAVGLLAGGVAHDFNNILTVITGYSELILKNEHSPDRDRVCEIANAAQRATSLTQQLLAFSRQQVLKPRVVSLNHAVVETTKMLRRVIGEDIQITTDLDPSLGAIKSDAGQIHQVLMNLAVNARDAMPRGGKLSLETRNVDFDEGDTHARPGLKPGAYVSLVVRDSGVGMSNDVAASIFEPFYTTKEVGRGTGLGLSTVYGIVKQSDGYIFVSSAPGKGSAFEILLPRTQDEISPEATVPRSSQAGTSTILLVEDDEAVRHLTREILAGHGHTVREASDGESALELLQSSDDNIALLITDLVMPRMGGLELANRLLSVRPDAKVLFTTGYAGGTPLAALPEDAEILKKPFSPAAFLQKVDDVIAGFVDLAAS